MNITISLGSWILPTVITVVALIGAVVIAAKGGRGCGDYGFSIIGPLAVIAAIAASVVAWVMYAGMMLFG